MGVAGLSGARTGIARLLNAEATPATGWGLRGNNTVRGAVEGQANTANLERPLAWDFAPAPGTINGDGSFRAGSLTIIALNNVGVAHIGIVDARRNHLGQEHTNLTTIMVLDSHLRPSNHPDLPVNIVPEPGSLIALGTGLVGQLALCRRV